MKFTIEAADGCQDTYNTIIEYQNATASYEPGAWDYGNLPYRILYEMSDKEIEAFVDDIANDKILDDALDAEIIWALAKRRSMME